MPLPHFHSIALKAVLPIPNTKPPHLLLELILPAYATIILHFSIALKVLLHNQADAMISPLSPSSFSSLMVVETSSTNKNEDIPSVLCFANPPSPLISAAPASSEVPSSTKRLKIDSAPAAAPAPTPALNESENLEREWALAATRNNGDNAFAAYLANMTQLSSQQLPRSQQRHPSQLPQLVTPKDNASFEAYLASVIPQQQRQLPPMPNQQQVTPKQPKPLTKAKKNKLEAAAMIEEINAINLDDEKDDKDREIYDSW